MKISTTLKNKLYALIPIVFWLIIWEALARFMNSALLLPTPFLTGKALITILISSTYYPIVLTSIYRVIAGFLLSLIFGFILGLIGGLYKPIYRLFSPLIITMKATPVISIIIIALLWFSSHSVPIFVAFLMCFPIIYTSTVEGIKHVDPRLLEMAHIYHVKKSLIITGIYIPSIKPYVITGIKNTLGLSFKVTVASEVLSAPKYSIGYELFSAKTYLESQFIFAWTIIIVILSYLFEYLFKLLLKVISK